MQSHLHGEAQAVSYLREKLKEQHGLEDGDEALETTLDGETRFEEAVEAICLETQELEARAEATNALIKRLIDKAGRYDLRAKKARESLASALDIAGKKTVRTAAGTVTLRSGSTSVVVTVEPATLPEQHRKERVTYTADKTAIKASLERGETLAYAYLSNGAPTIQIR